jgi:hypothetical protein
MSSLTRRMNMLLENKNAVIYGAGGALNRCAIRGRILQ